MVAPVFQFASAPISWGVQDAPDAAWEQPYERVLDELVAAGYAGTELGPYGYFPIDAGRLGAALERRGLSLLSSFVPVPLTEPAAAPGVLRHVRQVSGLLAALGAELLVVSDAQSPRRRALAGRIPVSGGESLQPEQWRQVGRLMGEVEKAAGAFGLSVVYHPHAGTYVETPGEVARFFEAAAGTNVGLCLDTGHCVYGGGDPAEEAQKYRRLLRYVHIKDIDARALAAARARELDFPGAVAAGVFSSVGEGCIYFPGFLGTLAEIDYSGWLVVEQDVKFGAPGVAPAASMAASRAFLGEAVADLAFAAA